MKICKVCNRGDVGFPHQAHTCTICIGRIIVLVGEGYTREDAKYKLSFGQSREGKIRYWNERLKKDKKW